MRRLVIAFVCLAVVASCARRPLPDFEDTPVPQRAGPPLSSEQVGKLIVAALNARNWAMEQKTPGRIVARQSQKRRSATIEVTYTETSYSIRYLSGENVGFSEEDGTKSVGKLYDRWIRELKAAIDNSLRTF